MNQKKVRFLKNINFFAHLPEDFLGSIVDVIEHRAFDRSDLVFSKGDTADGMYIVLDGEVGVTVGIKLLAQLQKGDFFGEMGLIAAAPRMASVGTVSKKVSTLFISNTAFDKIKSKMSPTDQKEILRRVMENVKGKK